MRCEQELEETVRKTQHNVSSLLETEDESVCFEPVGCNSSGPEFYYVNFLKTELGWGSDWGCEDSTREVFTKEYLRGLGWFPLALNEVTVLLRKLEMQETSSLCQILCDPFPLACWTPHKAWPCGVSGRQEVPGTTCSDVGLTVVKVSWSPETSSLPLLPEFCFLTNPSLDCAVTSPQSSLPTGIAQLWIFRKRNILQT